MGRCYTCSRIIQGKPAFLLEMGNLSIWLSECGLPMTLRDYLQESTSDFVLIHKQTEEKDQEEEGGGRGHFSNLALKDAASISPPAPGSPHVVWLPHGSETASAESSISAKFTAQCTGSQTPRKRAPRCCCLAAVAQCPRHCPALACWSGCHWCCCCVLEFHCLYYIQGWIRQPGMTEELYRPQIKTVGLGWQLPDGQGRQMETKNEVSLQSTISPRWLPKTIKK